MRFYAHGNQIPWTSSVSRRYKTRPCSHRKNLGLDAPEKQRGAAELSRIRELLPRFHPFPCCQGTTYARTIKKNQHFYWNQKHQKAFDTVKQALADATPLAAPSEEGRFVLDTDASAVAIAGILHQEQEHSGGSVLRPIVFGSKSLTRTQLNYGAPKLEMYAVFYLIEKFHSYLAGREFTLRVDNQALSWLKTYSMDQAMMGRWIARLDQYHFKTVHRPRTQHRNADGLSKRNNDYVHREKITESLPEVSK